MNTKYNEGHVLPKKSYKCHVLGTTVLLNTSIINRFTTLMMKEKEVATG